MKASISPLHFSQNSLVLGSAATTTLLAVPLEAAHSFHILFFRLQVGKADILKNFLQKKRTNSRKEPFSTSKMNFFSDEWFLLFYR